MAHSGMVTPGTQVQAAALLQRNAHASSWNVQGGRRALGTGSVSTKAMAISRSANQAAGSSPSFAFRKGMRTKTTRPWVLHTGGRQAGRSRGCTNAQTRVPTMVSPEAAADVDPWLIVATDESSDTSLATSAPRPPCQAKTHLCVEGHSKFHRATRAPGLATQAESQSQDGEVFLGLWWNRKTDGACGKDRVLAISADTPSPPSDSHM